MLSEKVGSRMERGFEQVSRSKEDTDVVCLGGDKGTSIESLSIRLV